MANITITRLTDDGREQFILDNQRAFRYDAMVKFGERDSHYEMISIRTIENFVSAVKRALLQPKNDH